MGSILSVLEKYEFPGVVYSLRDMEGRRHRVREINKYLPGTGQSTWNILGALIYLYSPRGLGVKFVNFFFLNQNRATVVNIVAKECVKREKKSKLI